MSPAMRLRKIPEATRNDERFDAKRLATAVPGLFTNGFCDGDSWLRAIHYKSSKAGSQPRVCGDVRSLGSTGFSLCGFVIARANPQRLKPVLPGPVFHGRLARECHA